jgi:hypothetical protein
MREMMFSDPLHSSYLLECRVSAGRSTGIIRTVSCCLPVLRLFNSVMEKGNDGHRRTTEGK